MSEIRIQKFLSAAGVASRRHAERLMEDGRVRVNGTVVTELGSKIDPERDVVELDGERVEVGPRRWVLLHKPAGHLTTRRDVRGRRTVYDLLPPGSEGLRYVGRLDRDTEGLLLFTNEGEMAHALLHPSSELAREYEAVVAGPIGRQAVARLEAGVELEDGMARAEGVRVLNADSKRSRVRLVVREGRNREVRRLLEAVGHPVTDLRRVRFGPLQLGDLPVGRSRALTAAEVDALRRAAGKGGGRRPQPGR